MVAHLLAEEGPLKGLVIDFLEGEEWVIGRDPDQADFILEDSMVSRKHVLCRKTDEGISVKNLSRVNPCLVNGEEIRGFHLLKEGERLQIGQNVFVFSEEALENPPPQPPPKKKKKDFSDTAFDAIFEEEGTPFGSSPSEPPSEEAHFLPEEEEKIPEPEAAKEEELQIPKKEEEAERTAYDTIFEDVENYEEVPFNLLGEASLILKVISGPNAGAEIGVQKNHTYVIGKEASSCDIVFQDLSVSRTHSRLSIDAHGKVEIEDMGSKNGTLINGVPIEQRKTLSPQDIVSLGTTTFLIIDREKETETIYSPAAARYEMTPEEESKEEVLAKEKEEELEEKIPWKKQIIPMRYLVMGASFVCIFFVVFLSFFSLFKTQKWEISEKGQTERIQEALAKFEDVQFSFTPSSGKLFLAGHVLTAVDAEELAYNLNQLPFIDSTENNVVIDEYVWKMVNDVLTENAGYKSVAVHSPKAGKFVATGYVESPQAYEQLSEYLNVNFPYLDRLDNEVAVESNLNMQIANLLQSKGFSAVTIQLAGGELVLSGRYNEKNESSYEKILKDLRSLRGIRSLKNFAIASTAQSAMVDLTQNYQVTGFSLYDRKNYSVVVNGRIITTGDNLDGMEIAQILPHTILLEKDGLKYKIDYSR